MGSLGGKKTSTQQTQNTTATMTPQAPNWIAAPTQDLVGRITSLSQQKPSLIGPSANQTSAFARANALSANPNGEAMDATRGLVSFTPERVAAGSLAEADLAPYMSPYQSEVIDRTLADLDRQRLIQINANNTGPAGAWGGSAQGVTNSLTNEAALREAGSLSATLRNQGFLNAQSAAAGDIDRRFQADTFNSAQGSAGAQLRLGAAGQLGEQALAGQAAERANIGLLGDLGAVERGITQENDPQNAEWTQIMRALLALQASNPELFTGQSTTGTSETTGVTRESGGGLGSLLNLASLFTPGGGGLLGVAGAIGGAKK